MGDTLSFLLWREIGSLEILLFYLIKAEDFSQKIEALFSRTSLIAVRLPWTSPKSVPSASPRSKKSIPMLPFSLTISSRMLPEYSIATFVAKSSVIALLLWKNAMSRRIQPAGGTRPLKAAASTREPPIRPPLPYRTPLAPQQQMRSGAPPSPLGRGIRMASPPTMLV